MDSIGQGGGGADGLYGLAGSGQVIELHGSIWRLRCTGCQAVTLNREVPLEVMPPHCLACGEMLRGRSGVFNAAAGAAWLGTFNGTGDYPCCSKSGSSRWDLALLRNGNLSSFTLIGGIYKFTGASQLWADGCFAGGDRALPDGLYPGGVVYFFYKMYTTISPRHKEMGL